MVQPELGALAGFGSGNVWNLGVSSPTVYSQAASVLGFSGSAAFLFVPGAAVDCLRVTQAEGVADLVLQNGMRLKMLQEEEIDLEDVFMGVTKGITN